MAKIELTNAQKELTAAINATFSDREKTHYIVAGKTPDRIKPLHTYLEPTITALSYEARKEYVIRILNGSMNDLNCNNVQQYNYENDDDDLGLWYSFPNLKHAILALPEQIKRYAEIDPETFKDLAN